jgi:eukaryotic-like serine/threonine-protein kinase
VSTVALRPPPFTHLGRYRVLSELGRGAMGVVYLCDDELLQRQLAVKTLLLPDDAGERKQLEARFRQEAKAAAGLNHPGIITIHDIGREGDWLYIAMELLKGTELRDRLQQGPMPLDEAVDIAAQVAAGLAVAHAQGVVHRDIKPGNIMLIGEGQAKIMDFGIARMKVSDVRTQSGTMMGSPKYMSPEQVGGHPVDARSDIFSLGSVLYEMLAGTQAFAGGNLGQLLNAILHATQPPLSQHRTGIPTVLELVVARALQKNPEARYQDAAEMARDLAQCRISLARARAAAPAVVRAPSDPYASTAPAGSEPPSIPLAADRAGLAPSPRFDSAVGLRRLLADRSAEPAPRNPPQRDLRAVGWSLAYVAAALGALVIAFG